MGANGIFKATDTHPGAQQQIFAPAPLKKSIWPLFKGDTVFK